MATLELEPHPSTRRILRVAREWWPVPALIASALVLQAALLQSRFDVGGHAAEHLSSASAPFMAAAVVGIIFWATPGARRQPDALVAALLWFVTTLAVMAGNLRVVQDLIDAGYSHTPTSTVPDVADHGLANAAPWFAVIAALVLVGVFRARGHIGNAAAIGCTVASVVVPPWIIPGAGVVVLAVVRCVARGRARPRRRPMIRPAQ